MKLFFAIVQAIILGALTFLIFDNAVDEYKGLTDADLSALAQEYFSRGDDKNQRIYASFEDAEKAAKYKISIGKKVQAASDMELRSKGVMMVGALSVLGFIGWFIVYFLTHVTTKPREAARFSPWERFSRYFLYPTALVSGLGGLLAFWWARYIIETL